MSASRLGLLLWIALGCVDDAPLAPTFIADVAPILAANCIRCHGDPPRGGAPDSFRLDRYEDREQGGRLVRGARTMALFSYERAAVRGDMPRVGPTLGDRQKLVLERWLRNPMRGQRRREHNPVLTLLGPQRPFASDDSITFAYRIDEADHDAVVGALRITPSGQVIAEKLHNGQGTLVWDTRSIVPGAYGIEAVMDDGSHEVTQPLGTVTISHRDGNTAPMVEVESPLLDMLISDDAAPVSVVVRAEDPDLGQSLRLALEAFHGGVVVPIREEFAISRGRTHIDWDARQAPAGTNWQVRARVSDGTSSVVALSAVFVIAHGQTQETYQAMEPLISAQCGRCHDVLVSAFQIGTYESVVAQKGNIWRRVALYEDMPSPSLRILFPQDPPLSPIDRERLANWLSAGAPR